MRRIMMTALLSMLTLGAQVQANPCGTDLTPGVYNSSGWSCSLQKGSTTTYSCSNSLNSSTVEQDITDCSSCSLYPTKPSASGSSAYCTDKESIAFTVTVTYDSTNDTASFAYSGLTTKTGSYQVSAGSPPTLTVADGLPISITANFVLPDSPTVEYPWEIGPDAWVNSEHNAVTWPDGFTAQISPLAANPMQTLLIDSGAEETNGQSLSFLYQVEQPLGGGQVKYFYSPDPMIVTKTFTSTGSGGGGAGGGR